MTGQIVNSPCPIRRLGSDAGHHFFGYYNKTVWDRTGRYVLANHVPVADAHLIPTLEAEVGFFDLADNDRFYYAGKTTAWNWQMGCQLQWLDGATGRQLIYNCRTDKDNSIYPGYASVVYDVESETQRLLPLPIYSVAPDSRFALCVNYSRLYITHETIGYPWKEAPESMPKAPADDGIHCLDIATGQSQLVISYADLRNFHPVDSMENALHWVSHIEISPDSSRFLLLHRWTERVKDETCFLHRLITANPDGTEMRLLEDSDHPLPQLAADFDPNAVGTYDYEKSEYQISHPLWCADGSIIVWGPHAGSIHYHRYTDAADTSAEVIGKDILTENGHMSFSPVNARWLLSDTYPDASTHERILFIFDTQQNVRYDIGSFYADPKLKKENRCDLHPRWSRDGKNVCIDSVHENERQMYVIDVSQIVDC